MKIVTVPKPLPGTRWGAHKEEIIKKLPLTKGFCPSKLTRTEDNKCPCKIYRENKNCVCQLYDKL